MKYIIKGGNQLSGEVNISGAKNSVLPILAATILTDQCDIKNIPELSDVKYTLKIIDNIKKYNEIPPSLSNKMRSSILFAGAMLAKNGEVKINYPGGCQIGKRPIELHLSSLEKMGAEIKINENMVIAKASKLKGCNIKLPIISVGATENIIIAGSVADGITTIENAAIEPEILDLINFINCCGGDISIKNRCITIKGVKQLNSCEYNIIPDRIEAITYICFAAATNGELFLKNISDKHIKKPLEILKAMGLIIKPIHNGLYVDSPRFLKSISHFETAPYPSIPTDIQPQLSVLMSIANGSCNIKENIFSNRTSHIPELIKMGADIQSISNTEYIVNGVEKLKPNIVNAYDLRAGAALIAAALKADGISVVENSHHIKRGYEKITEKLNNIGAEIEEI